LRSSECQVSEDGKTQAIAFFHLDGTQQQEPIPLGPQEFSNRASFARIHPTVILLDLLSERQLPWGQAGEELVKSLSRLEWADGVYIYVLTNTGTFYAVRPLPRAEGGFRPAQASWTQQIRSLFDRVSRDFAGFRPIDDQDPGWRAQLTLQALSQFASQMAVIPGRKTLVWITHGIPSAIPGIAEDQMIDLMPLVRLLGEAFVQSNTAVYTVAQSAAGAGGPIGYSLETLQTISGLTGGRAYSSDAIENAITDATTDVHASYVVGYYPKRQQRDGKFHKLRVACARKGVRPLTKQGYWAFHVQATPDQREQEAIAAAIDRPFDDPTIGLRTTISSVLEKPQTFRVQIRVDAADLLLLKQNDRYSGQLGLGLMGSGEGVAQPVTPAPLQLSLTREQFEQVAKHGIEITRDLAVDRTTQAIRVVVFDRNSNLTESVTIPIEH
jgi:VWFA-related protein